jgi:hypothetical protein
MMLVTDPVLDKAIKYLDKKTIITGGHFRIFFNKDRYWFDLNDGTVNSFKYALNLFQIAKKKNIKADIGILINDMSSICDTSGCIREDIDFSRDNFILPDKLRKMLDEDQITNSDLKLYWEKHIRNRGKKYLKRIIRRGQQSIYKNRGEFFIEDEKGFGKIILTRKNIDDRYGTPACPLIMAGLNMEQDAEYSNSINFYYIGDDNLNNIPNYFAIEKGTRVAKYFGTKIEIHNIYIK